MKGAKSNPDSKKRDRKVSVRSDSSRTKRPKQTKDPNKPKRPPSAFFVFMEDFRIEFKKEHPSNKSVAAVGKAGGDRWKSLSDTEKAPFITKAEKRKDEYNKNMQAYNKKISNEASEPAQEEEESDKSKSEVNDEDDDDDGSGEGEDDD